MKFGQKMAESFRKKYLKASLGILSMLSPMVAMAEKKLEAEDIVKTIQSGSLGKTIGKDGAIWGLLIGISFLVAAAHAATKNDPKAFIPAFVVTTLISTVIGYFLVF